MRDVSSAQIATFQKTVLEYYAAHARNLPWRPPALKPGQDGIIDPYKILVSEIMLQQTQASRVVPKYQQFLKRFPDLEALAVAPLSDVLRVWSGLGYNRRAKFIWEAAQILVSKPTPWSMDDLLALKGIGPNTAGAIWVYAYNQPIAFVETNIRTVFIHHFFAGQQKVSDKMILEMVQRTLATQQPREWFYGLMDYGAHLKLTVGNLAQASNVYTKQSPFKGSKRQIRGQVLRALGDRSYHRRELEVLIPDDRLSLILNDLQAEGFVRSLNNIYRLA